jgi:hypothetical protein
MKKNKNIKFRILILALMVLPFGTGPAGPAVFASQDESKVDPDFSFSCVQNDQEFVLKTRMSYWTGERDMPISGEVITFYITAGEEARPLGAVPTDMNGEAVCKIEKGSERLISVEGDYTFSAVFEGNQEYEMAEDMVEVRPLNLHIEFTEIDSVKTIVAEAYETDQEGNPVPLEETDVYFYVPRSFSLLPVGDGWFEEGRAQLDFPTTLPGDSIGNLTIIARIQDHELFGNVEAVAVKEWGKAMPRVVFKKRRGLGDTDAPLWMVYTLIVLLSIVWFHYLYVFYVMIKIKRLRRNQEVNYDTSSR